MKRTSDKSLFPMALGSCGHRITHQLRPINMNGRSILAVTSIFGITAEQKEKIKETHAGFAAKYKAQRAQRLELRQSDLDAVSAILTAEQREKVKNFVEDGVEAPNDK